VASGAWKVKPSPPPSFPPPGYANSARTSHFFRCSGFPFFLAKKILHFHSGPFYWIGSLPFLIFRCSSLFSAPSLPPLFFSQASTNLPSLYRLFPEDFIPALEHGLIFWSTNVYSPMQPDFFFCNLSGDKSSFLDPPPRESFPLFLPCIF